MCCCEHFFICFFFFPRELCALLPATFKLPPVFVVCEGILVGLFDLNRRARLFAMADRRINIWCASPIPYLS